MHDLLLITLPLSSWRSKGRASDFLPFSQSSKSSAVCQLRILRGQSQNKSCLRKSPLHSSLVAEQLHPCSHTVLRIISHSHVAQKDYEAYSGPYNYPTAETVATQLLMIQKAQVGDNNVLLIPKGQPKHTPPTHTYSTPYRSSESKSPFWWPLSAECPDLCCLGEQGRVGPSSLSDAVLALFFFPRSLKIDGSSW